MGDEKVCQDVEEEVERMTPGHGIYDDEKSDIPNWSGGPCNVLEAVGALFNYLADIGSALRIALGKDSNRWTFLRNFSLFAQGEIDPSDLVESDWGEDLQDEEDSAGDESVRALTIYF